MNNLLTWIGKQFVITAVILYCLHNYMPNLFPSINLGCGYGTGISNASYQTTKLNRPFTILEPLGGLDE